MLIFNTTYQVSTKLYSEWLQWIRTEHIPFMLKTGKFSQPQIARIFNNDDNEGASYSLQFLIENMHELHKWHLATANEFETHCSRKFGSEVLFFSTILELID